MPVDLIIRNGNVVRPTGVARVDLAIDGGKFVEIGEGLSLQARETIDAANQFVFPGVIDSHVHFNEPGRTDWEGIETGSMALAAGGGTCFFDMPLNSSPPVLDGESFDRKLECAKAKSYTDFALWGGLTPDNLDKMEELADRGVVGFKAFMCDSGIDDFRRADAWTLQRGMQTAAKLDLPVAVHAEDQELVEGKAAWIQTLPIAGSPKAWTFAREPVAEAVAIDTAVLLAQSTKCDLHVVHISNRYCVEQVSIAARSGIRVTAETCPHYLTLSVEDVERIGTSAKCAPPIRYVRHAEKLWDCIREGQITLIASDHSPSPPSMKSEADFFKAWGGISGVQSTLALMLVEGHLKRSIDLGVLADLSSGAPSRRYRLIGKGSIELGNDADLVLVDLARAVELKPDHLLQLHKISPYIGMKIHGMIQRTILRGKTIFRDGKIHGPPSGQFIRPERGKSS